MLPLESSTQHRFQHVIMSEEVVSSTASNASTVPDSSDALVPGATVAAEIGAGSESPVSSGRTVPAVAKDITEDEPTDDAAASLGFLAVPEKPHSLHRRFFPSKVGGKPAWLDPHHLPDGDVDLQCPDCQLPMTFLLQVYASRSAPADAFHRTIYLFVCCNCASHVVALRCQLPRNNPFYPSVPADVETDTSTDDECLRSRCCPECGIPTSLREPEQVSDLDAIEASPSSAVLHPQRHLRCRNAVTWGLIDAVFPESELEIDDEVPVSADEEAGSLSDFSHEKQLLERYKAEEQQNPDHVLDESEQQAFIDIQNERSSRDPVFAFFLKHRRCNPDHVIRYAPSGRPLWLSSYQKPTPEDIAQQVGCCPNCGGPRVFEFQVQPSLIYELRTDRLSFGVLCVYTCQASCSAPSFDVSEDTAPSRTSRYVQEAVVVQPEPFRVEPQ